ncbi:MAG: class I adenylate cyclase [Desulfobacteraceae bacterium]
MKPSSLQDFQIQWEKSKADERIAMILAVKEMEPDQGLEFVFFALRDISRPIRLAARETLAHLAGLVTVNHREPLNMPREKTLKNEMFSIVLVREMKRITAQEEFKEYLIILLSIGGRGPSHAWALFLGNTMTRNAFIDILRRLPETLRLRLVHRYLFSEITDRRQQAPHIRLLLKEITDVKAASCFIINLLYETDESLFALLTRTGELLFDFAERLKLTDAIINKGLTSDDSEEIREGALIAGAFDLKDKLYKFLTFLDPYSPEALRTGILSVIERSRTEPSELIVTVLTRLLNEDNPAIATAAFSTLASMGHSRCPDAAINLITKKPHMREAFYPALIQLKTEDLIALFDKLPEVLALEARKAVARILFLEKPARAETLFGYGKTDQDSAIRETATLFFQQISEIRTREIKDKILELAPPVFSAGGSKPNDSRILSFLKNPATHPLEKFQKLWGEIIRDIDLSGIRIENADLSGMTFMDCDLTSAVFVQCSMKNTRFENGSLTHGRFESCGLESALFVNVDGVSASFTGCCLFNAWFYKSRFEFSDFVGNAFTGTRFLSCDFSKSDFSASTLTCATFHLCDMNHATVHQAEFVHTLAMASDFKGVHLSDTAVFMESDLDQRSSHWDSLEIPALYFEKKLLATRWLTILILTHAMDEQRHVFLAHNQRARERALDAFNPDQEDLFDLVPLLIHLTQRILPIERSCDDHEIMDHALLKKACSGISNYDPSPKTIALAKKHLRVDKLLPVPGKECHIQGLFTIGSVGTIAQSQDSDIDYWVCVDTKTMPPEAQNLLKLKLASIERWAATHFGTEIHFFVMDPESIKEGRFGGSDFESSGSAQSMMLKEEFYRTMILVAGKIPFWCVLPGWTDTKQYPLLYSIASRFHDDYLDLGHVSAIPPGEYFGASMWQLFKSLKSPYKSVMKMALLEKYIHEGRQGILLCDLLKQRRASGKTHFRREDPYILLFEETTNHYLKTDQTDTMDLIRLCFFLKLSIASSKHLEGSVFKIRKIVVKKCMENYGWKAEELHDLGQFSQWPFKKVLELSERTNRFMIRTYNKLSKLLSGTSETGTLITAEDLTVLGRKMFVQFADQSHKVKTLPLAVRGRKLLSQLYIHYRQPQGKSPAWDIFPFYDKDIMAKSNDLAILNDVARIEDVAAFVIHNGIYASGTLFTLLPNPTPLTAQDFLHLLKEVNDFFPYGESDSVAPSAYLEPAKIRRLYLIVNFALGKKADLIYEFAVVYTTTWGEMYCRTYKDSAGISKSSDALKKIEGELGLTCHDAKIGCYVPRMTKRKVGDLG